MKNSQCRNTYSICIVVHYFSMYWLKHPLLCYNLCLGLVGFSLMGWSLLHNALRPSIISQLVLFLWQTVETDPLGHVRVVETLQNFVQKCDPTILSDIHIHVAGVQQFHCS
jgi:hypothetical protein